MPTKSLWKPSTLTDIRDIVGPQVERRGDLEPHVLVPSYALWLHFFFKLLHVPV